MGCEGQEEGSLCSFSAFMIPGNCKLQTLFPAWMPSRQEAPFALSLGVNLLLRFPSFDYGKVVTTHLPPNSKFLQDAVRGRSILFPLSLTLKLISLEPPSNPHSSISASRLTYSKFWILAKSSSFLSSSFISRFVTLLASTMKPILFTGLLAGLIHPTAVLAEMIYDYNSIRVGSNTATCRVDAALDGRDTVGSYTWTFFWKYATNTADLVPTNGSLAWTLPAFGDTYHLANCSVSSSWYPSDHSKAEEYLVAGGVPSVTHKVFGMPVGNGAAGFGSLKSGGPSSALTVSLIIPHRSCGLFRY